MSTQNNPPGDHPSNNDPGEEQGQSIQPEETITEHNRVAEETQPPPDIENTKPSLTTAQTPDPTNIIMQRWRLEELGLLPARLRRIHLTTPGPSNTLSSATEIVVDAKNPLRKGIQIWKGARRQKEKRDPLANWQNWSRFRLWRHTRPLAGSLLIIFGASLMLAGNVVFLPLALLVNSLWPAFLVGGCLLVMGVIPLFLPSYAVITGSIGIVLSLVSLLVASFGGFGIGMLCGIIGGALSIAWRPVKSARLLATRSSLTS